MSRRRKLDSTTLIHGFRAPSRLFLAEGAWYFRTREGRMAGPFADRYKAELTLRQYVETMSTVPAGECDTGRPIGWQQTAVADDCEPMLPSIAI